MKTTRVLGLAILAGSLATSFTTFADSPFSEQDARNNAAVANSPRARESFPWLTRTAPVGERSTTRPAERNNISYAKSPRVLEEYPELARGPLGGTSARSVDVPEWANRAFAASPRAKEEFPALRISSKAPDCVCVVTRVRATEK
jgi:hypothetical protein